MTMDDSADAIRKALASAAFKKRLRQKQTKRLRRIAKTSFEVQVPNLEEATSSVAVPDIPPGSPRRREA